MAWQWNGYSLHTFFLDCDFPLPDRVFRICSLSVALQTASRLQVALCSSECCVFPEDQDSAKPCSPGYSPLLESKHASWALSSTGNSVGSVLRLEHSYQCSLSSFAWVLNCNPSPDANVLPFVFLSFFFFLTALFYLSI